MHFKPISLAFLASLAFHASAGISLYATAAADKKIYNDAIAISYVDTPRQQVVPVKNGSAWPVQKTVQQKQYPKLKKVRAQKKSASATTSSQVSAPPPPADAAKPKSSAELLADPQKGKIFSAYFTAVKEKIFKTLKEKYDVHSSGAGDVTLVFVLNPDGQLSRVSALEKDSAQDDALKRLAVNCLKSAAPFGRFPDTLASSQIAFQVKIYFDEVNG